MREKLVLLALLFSQNTFAAYSLFGLVPGQYVGQNKASYAKALVTVDRGVIVSVQPMQSPPAGALVLQRQGASDLDVIYPGLFNLHNHTKQNVLGAWNQALGQFQNRFEWRGFSGYKDAVSGNMNPWIGLGSPIGCASFRYSELRALALGTTYLQGPSSCVTDFAINKVEDAHAFLNLKGLSAVAAPTDLIFPNEMAFVHDQVLPIMMKNAGAQNMDQLLQRLTPGINSNFTYEAGLQAVIKQFCPALVSQNPVLASQDPVQATESKEALAVLSVSSNLEKGCVNMPDGMRRYVFFIHPPLAGKKNMLRTGRYSGMIAHLAEGRRNDPYNKIEFKLMRLLGLDAPRVNLVHGVGIDAQGFAFMAQRGMGLVWSPFSNHLLYNETTDIASAVRAGVPIALGSDWTPTGTRGTLEEAKMARKYLISQNLQGVFGGDAGMDEALYNMMTANPAKMIGHDGEAGTVAARAAASLIVVSKQDPNPFTNLVLRADESAVNLVIVDGKPVYGNLAFVKATADLGITPKAASYEDLGIYFPQVNRSGHVSIDPSLEALVLNGPDDSEDDSDTPDPDAAPATKGPKATKDQKLQYLNEIAMAVHSNRIPGLMTPADPVGSACHFSERKVLVPQDSLAANNLTTFEQQTGLNLDTVHDIVALLQVSLITQSRDKASGNKSSATMLSPIYSCQDHDYLARIGGTGTDASTLFETYVSSEITRERVSRAANRSIGGSNVPANLAAKYGLPFAIQ